MKKVLLLNKNYSYVNFITERHAINLICREKVEILSIWPEKIPTGSSAIDSPAVLRLVNFGRLIIRTPNFSRKSVFKRDNFICQYCGLAGTPNQLSLDHVYPRSLGGQTTWQNCVTACKPCNLFKDNKTLDQIGLKLLTKPTVPGLSALREMKFLEKTHPDWHEFINS